jgi:methylenetetrahydrofolate--tRNA-(uracil-5-)-methyltransferase
VPSNKRLPPSTSFAGGRKGLPYDSSSLLPRITVVGGGLAGTEAAWQIAERGLPVDLYEMRPARQTPAHTSDRLAELVCSNSFRSASLENAVGLIKEEMRRLGSLVMRAGDAARVPAGDAHAVDRTVFADQVSAALAGHPLVRIHRQEVSEIPGDGIAIIGTDRLFFFDAISPIVEADSIDRARVFRASRYGKGGGEDYLNCPLDEEQYRRFHEALVGAELIQVHEFEAKLCFEGCLPIEVMAQRGIDTLRFGPMKPVGLTDPRTGKRPYAVVQLRQDNLAADLYSMVGFQTRLRWPEQKRVLRTIPGLEQAHFVRLGQMHRNTYLNAPAVLYPSYQARKRETLFFAGVLSGVEGYIESAASGLLAGIYASRLARGLEIQLVPPTTAMGAMAHYITHARPEDFQPSNVIFGIFPALEQSIRDKRDRRREMAERALRDLGRWIEEGASS